MMSHLEHYKHHIIVDDELIDEELLEPKQGLFTKLSSLITSDKKVGELNGKWATLFKVVLIVCILVIPTLLGWATWVTTEVFSYRSHADATTGFDERITKLENATSAIARIEKQIDTITTKIDALPPPEWKRRIEILESQYTTISNQLDAVDKTNTSEHGQILVLLEGIKTKVDMIK
jgi:hypothetical protein